MEEQDLSMQSLLDGVRLLIFTSKLLPAKSQSECSSYFHTQLTNNSDIVLCLNKPMQSVRFGLLHFKLLGHCLMSLKFVSDGS